MKQNCVVKLWPDPKTKLCCVVKLWWSQLPEFWKLWNCGSQFVMFVKLWFAHFEFWKPLKNLSFAMNGFEESYYTIPKSNISRLKIFDCSLRSIFFKIFSKIGQILETKIVLFTDFTIFHNLWNCEGPWNWIVLCCDCDACSKIKLHCVVKLWLYNFTKSQFYFTTLVELCVQKIESRSTDFGKRKTLQKFVQNEGLELDLTFSPELLSLIL